MEGRVEGAAAAGAAGAAEARGRMRGVEGGVAVRGEAGELMPGGRGGRRAAKICAAPPAVHGLPGARSRRCRAEVGAHASRSEADLRRRGGRSGIKGHVNVATGSCVCVGAWIDQWASRTIFLAATGHAAVCEELGRRTTRPHGGRRPSRRPARCLSSAPPASPSPNSPPTSRSSCRPTPRARARAPVALVVGRRGGRRQLVVSEARRARYRLLVGAGVALASEPRESECWRKALSLGEELFAGWRLMCERTRNSCQAYARQGDGRRRSASSAEEGASRRAARWRACRRGSLTSSCGASGARARRPTPTRTRCSGSC